MSKANPFLKSIAAAAAARKPADDLDKLEKTLAGKRREDLNTIVKKPVQDLRTNDDCASELDKLRTSNPYRDALIKIGRIDVIADIELGSLKTEEEIRAKFKELIMSGDTSSNFYELLSSKVFKMDEEAKKKEVDKFKNDEKERNKDAYEKMIKYMHNNKIADARDLTSLLSEDSEEKAKKKLQAPLPTYIGSVLKLIDHLKIPEKKIKEDAYRALFYLLPDKFGGTNQVANEEKRVYIYDKIKEAQKNASTQMAKFGAMKRIVSKVRAGSRGGKSGQWSARKAQLSVNMYKKAGGGYKGRRSSNNSLRKWTQQRWRTRSGKNSILGPGATGERYLPEKAIRKLSRKEYSSTTRAKRRSLKKRKQYSKQPKKIARRLKRLTGRT